MTLPALTPGRVVRELFVSSRPVSWINTAFPFAAAYLLTTRQIDVPLIVGILFFLVPYNLAMYGVNDVFDYESDLRNPRKGGTHGAVLAKRRACRPCGGCAGRTRSRTRRSRRTSRGCRERGRTGCR